MSGPYRFKNPNAGRNSPFRDEQGRNPFADEAPTPVEASGDPLAPPQAGAAERGPSYQPRYEATLQPHTVTVMAAGLGGLASAALALLVPPLILLAIILAFIAIRFSQFDLTAIDQGALDQGRGAALAGLILGVVTLLAAITEIVVAVWQLFFAS